MNLQKLRYFVAVADHANFTKAAQSCYVSQPALCRQIAQLEREWGITLFERDTHKVRLTAQGAACLDDARRVIAAYEALDSTVDIQKRAQHATLHLGYVGGCSNEILNAFADSMNLLKGHYTDCDFSVEAGPGGELLEKLHDNQLDLAAVLNCDLTEDKRLLSFTLTDWHLCAAISKRNPLSQRASIALRDLAPFPLYTAADSNASRFFACIQQQFHKQGLVPKFRRFTNDIAELLLLAGSDSGISLMTSTAESSCLDNVSLVPISDFADEFHLKLVYLHANRNPLLNQAVSLIAERFDALKSAAQL